ncbi:RNA degradosome polyphosphate kinase [Salipaludibacillus agaradhaerens]|uniref:Polyphosphate kinase n=1 Tax=Salipaludibacillus agaradhaerens TaxID=76935 RepID=A0A9Q4FZH6_SALAG|nr:RNA degradosome polyphosphate kinase [Salipaludibacillus agaradhaerens]MCR6096754.1 RNA degradosome polyphosphate kinase [Salipaludibacillus agaradhaerens]MCR6113687.1 RNA degradosome polyphosphate kinase [Salipaludibacillus agaradhaerens]
MTKMIKSVLLDDPAYYNNRELSWLSFNERVLQEAMDKNNPLLERLKFMAIFSSNLDEFFMVRVAGLKDQVKAGFNKPENKAGLTPKQQLNKIAERSHHLVKEQYHLYTQILQPLLEKEGIYFLTMTDLNDTQYEMLANHFHNYILPVLTPMAIDAYRPFPMLLNKSLNLAILLGNESNNDQEQKLAIVQVPSVLKRTIILPTDSHYSSFIFLEDVISHFINDLFQGYSVMAVSPFRITRNADLTIHEEDARDLLAEIEKELKKRKWGRAVRLEIQANQMDENLLSFLMGVLELSEDDVYSVEGPLDFSFFTSFYENMAQDWEHLVNDAYIPQPPADLRHKNDLFQAILEKDIFLHHPYESFQPVVDLITHAAKDPDVLAIKQTLYRVSGDSPIIQALTEAADAGKQVTVLVELKARFDEEKNIQWAKRLEKSGVHVIYGITGLKTHSKITLIIRHDNDTIQRFVHLGTGNYNDSTAKFYTDMGLLTSRASMGEDATNFFNYLSGFTCKPKWHDIIISPVDMRDKFLMLIEQEITYHSQHGNGRIIAKMNSLTDKPIIVKLYEASKKGVKIDLIVRGICCLKPGIPHVSENITVRSIVDRFLEHSRIFYFHHNGEEALFLSSADWMTRNMDKRIEILFPIYSKDIKDRIINVLTLTLKDNVKARLQHTDGTYHYASRHENEPTIQSQRLFYEEAAMFFEDD